jgi:hypothetical protein
MRVILYEGYTLTSEHSVNRWFIRLPQSWTNFGIFFITVLGPRCRRFSVMSWPVIRVIRVMTWQVDVF